MIQNNVLLPFPPLQFPAYFILLPVQNGRVGTLAEFFAALSVSSQVTIMPVHFL